MKNKKKTILLILFVILIISIIICIIKLSEMYEDKIDYDFSMESKEDLFFEDEEDNNEKFKENLNYISTISEQEKKENNSISMRQFTYVFKKQELYGNELKINVDETYIDGEYLYTECLIRITDSFVTSVEIGKIYDEKNQIEFLDENKNTKKEFKNGEKIVVKCPRNTDLTYVEYNIKIEFIYNNEKYKICVNKGLPVSDPYVGAIDASFYDEDSKLLIRENVKLYRILEEQNRTILIGNNHTGTEGKIKYYMVPVGKYKFVKIINGKEIESSFFEVKRHETTYIEF